MSNHRISMKRKWKLKQALWGAQRGSCAICKDVFDDLTLDHILPIALGGTNWLGNLQLVCEPCNQRKGCKLEDGSRLRDKAAALRKKYNLPIERQAMQDEINLRLYDRGFEERRRFDHQQADHLEMIADLIESICATVRAEMRKSA